MGSRSDIENRQGNSRGLTYTCNCGWLDLGHMDPTSSQPFVGANDLWRQLKDATTATHCAYTLTPRGPVALPGWKIDLYRPVDDDVACYQPGLFQMALMGISKPFFGPGFVVNFTQQVEKVHVGYHGRYLVRPGLPDDVKKRIALTIMLEVSYGLEDLQHSAGLFTDSGYAADDLTANVIGLLIAMGEVTLEEALASCHEVSKSTALYLWDNRERGLHRDYDRPILHADTSRPSGTNHDGTTLMIDECAGQPRKPPDFLTRIEPLTGEEARQYYTNVKSGYGFAR